MVTPKKPSAKRVRRSIDHDAVERDYRCGSFTLRELAAKHGCTHQAIAKMAKTRAWPQDLSRAVRAATNASVIQETVAKAAAESGQVVANSVLAAAEVNKQVILQHRTRLLAVTASAEIVRGRVMGLIEGILNIRDAGAAMGAIEAYARVTKLVIERERESFKLDDEAADTPLTRVVIVPQKDDELVQRVAQLVDRVRPATNGRLL